jgi:hypothetical protein
MPTHVLTIPDFTPASLNALTRGKLRDRMRLSRGDRDLVAFYARQAGIPAASGPRRVSVLVTMTRGRLVDPDNVLKSALDSLVACGLLLDDDAARCELGSVRVTRGERRETTFTLEDL